jgi:hypothetical protein
VHTSRFRALGALLSLLSACAAHAGEPHRSPSELAVQEDGGEGGSVAEVTGPSSENAGGGSTEEPADQVPPGDQGPPCDPGPSPGGQVPRVHAAE